MYYTRNSKIYFNLFASLLLSLALFSACDNFYVGKSEKEIKEELMQSMFEVDSLIGNIKIILGDSSAIERK